MSAWKSWRPTATNMAALLLVAFVLAAIFAPLVAPVDPNRQDLLARLKPPGTEIRDTFYLLGTE